MDYIKIGILFTAVFIALKCDNLPKQRSDIVVDEDKCDKETAVTVKCFNEKTEEITKGGAVRRHERILVKIEQIEGACKFTIPQFRLVILGPKSPDANNDTAEVAIQGTKYNSNNFEIRPYMIKEIGRNTLKFFPMSGETTKAADPATCSVEVDYSKVKAMIKGGTEKTYRSNQLTIDRKTAEIPPSESQNKYVFKVSVTVRPANVPGSQYEDDTSQIVRFSELAADLQIQCVKNCAPHSEKTITSMIVILKASCSNCRTLDSNVYYYWTIQDSKDIEIDYTKLKNDNRKGDTCYMKPGALKDDQEYTAKVAITGDKKFALSAEVTLDTRLPPPLKDCTISPPSGTAFETGFQAKCTYFPADHTFEIYSVKDGKDMLLCTTNTLENEIFLLPAGASVRIHMTENKSGYIQIATINVKVKEVLNLAEKTSNEEIAKAVEDKMDDVLEFVASRKPEMALQGLAAVVGEYSNMPADKKDLEFEMDSKAIQRINSININTPDQAKQAVDIVSRITEKYQDNPDPELSLQSSAICNKASKILTAEANEIDNPDLHRTHLTNNIMSLASCSQAGLGQNIEAVEEEEVAVTFPDTEAPPIESNKIPEQYDDYVDDIKSSENMAKFEQASRRMKYICFSNAKMIALTMVPEEDPVINVQGSMSIVSLRRYCDDVPNTDVVNNVVKLHPSSDCQRSPVIDILMCTVDKNPYWWKNNTPLITKVVYAKFGRSKYKRSFKRNALDEDPSDTVDELNEFTDPFTITFERYENMTNHTDVHHEMLPHKNSLEMDENSFNEEVSMHRIYVFKNRRFRVSFENMMEDDYYDILLTEFEKPSYQYFKTHSQTIFMENHWIEVIETRSYDTFWFLSVLPNKKMEKLTDKLYYFSVSAVACFTWNETVKAWVYACNASLGTSNITCFCSTGNVFTGHIINNKINLVENILIDFQLQLQQCWIIFITTLITFILSCVLLLYGSFERKKHTLDKVFFVGDVPSYFQYAYIIAVKTGNKRYSGTTSNVTIRLYGSASDSLEHVINYPDPELILLQRDMETWFVIATENLLGDLDKIEIWFDSVGNNTRWYGSKIEVYDIQQDKSWEFKLENWFDVMKDEHNHFIIFPERKLPTPDNKQGKKRRVYNAIRNFLGRDAQEVNLWNLGTKDPLLMLKERVAIICSTLMTMYLAIMLLYNIPSFDESDTIDENVFGLHYKLIWTPIVGSTFAFLVHFPLTYIIKRDKFINFGKKGFSITKNDPIICWMCIICLMTLCITVLICCGFWIPEDTSLLWLTSVIIGIFFNVMVLQNVSCIIYGHWLKLSVQVESFAKTTKNIIHYVELQRTWLFKRFGALSLRPYFQHLYVRLDFVALRDRIKMLDLNIQTIKILEDLIMIVIYVALLYVVLTLDKEPMAVYSHKAIKNLLTGRAVRSKMDPDTISDVEDYLDKILIPSIQSLQWYGKYVQENPGMTKDFSNKYLGIIRIRQHRTKEVPCVVPKEMEFLNITCRPDFNMKKEFGNFSRRWVPASKLTNLVHERMDGSWKYSSSNITGTLSYFGKLTYYPGGGYVSTLGRTLKNSLINLKYIKKYAWLDLRTRAVLIEFLTYNPNVNLFNTVQAVFEVSAAGSIESKLEIQTRKLLMVDNEKILTKRVINVSFLVILSILFMRVSYKFVRNGKKIIYDLWTLFDLGIVILSLVSITLYYLRLRSIRAYVNDLTQAKNNEFVNYFHLFTRDNLLTSLTATLVFIATFRLWKLLRFMIIVQTAEKTLRDAALPLLVCLVYQSVYIMAFSISGTIFFGADSKDFKDILSSVTTLMLLSIGLYPDFDIDPIRKHPLGTPYFTLYALFSLFFITVYVAIITLYYADAKDYYSGETGFVTTFIQKKWTYYKTLCTVRVKNLRGGADTEPYERVIKPRIGDRYEDCMTIPNSRIHAMALISMCVLRNEKQHPRMTDKDFEVISKMIKTLFEEESSEKEAFFLAGDTHHIDLVDNRKLEEIADICERLVVESKNLIRVSRKIEKPFFENRIQRITALIENVKTISRILDNVQINT